MDLLIDIGTLLLTWTLVAIALVFFGGTFLMVKTQRKAALSKIKRPRLTSGEVVVFEDNGKDRTFLVTSIRFDGKRRDVTLQDQASWAEERRHDEIPT